MAAVTGERLLNGGDARPADASDPSRSLYPAPRNERFATGSITPESRATTWNNFYEFGTSKDIARAAQSLIIRPWQMRIDGLVDKSVTIGIDDLLAEVNLEERVYRHRCVEGWAMVVPWTGFPLRALLDLAKPLNSAKYLRMESFDDAAMASGQRQSWYPWPYVEGLTMAEAAHELAFVVTGAYGKVVAKSMGAPVRVAIPWKYGFKSIKSVTRWTFTDERPRTFWQQINRRDYGFWANVNPSVRHGRLSQASERDLGTGETRPTLLFNGYADSVASLYTGLGPEPLYM